MYEWEWNVLGKHSIGFHKQSKNKTRKGSEQKNTSFEWTTDKKGRYLRITEIEWERLKAVEIRNLKKEKEGEWEQESTFQHHSFSHFWLVLWPSVRNDFFYLSFLLLFLFLSQNVCFSFSLLHLSRPPPQNCK